MHNKWLSPQLLHYAYSTDITSKPTNSFPQSHTVRTGLCLPAQTCGHGASPTSRSHARHSSALTLGLYSLKLKNLIGSNKNTWKLLTSYSWHSCTTRNKRPSVSRRPQGFSEARAPLPSAGSPWASAPGTAAAPPASRRESRRHSTSHRAGCNLKESRVQLAPARRPRTRWERGSGQRGSPEWRRRERGACHAPPPASAAHTWHHGFLHRGPEQTAGKRLPKVTASTWQKCGHECFLILQH